MFDATELHFQIRSVLHEAMTGLQLNVWGSAVKTYQLDTQNRAQPAKGTM